MCLHRSVWPLVSTASVSTHILISCSHWWSSASEKAFGMRIFYPAHAGGRQESNSCAQKIFSVGYYRLGSKTSQAARGVQNAVWQLSTLWLVVRRDKAVVLHTTRAEWGFCKKTYHRVPPGHECHVFFFARNPKPGAVRRILVPAIQLFGVSAWDCTRRGHLWKVLKSKIICGDLWRSLLCSGVGGGVYEYEGHRRFFRHSTTSPKRQRPATWRNVSPGCLVSRAQQGERCWSRRSSGDQEAEDDTSDWDRKILEDKNEAPMFMTQVARRRCDENRACKNHDNRLSLISAGKKKKIKVLFKSRALSYHHTLHITFSS